MIENYSPATADSTKPEPLLLAAELGNLANSRTHEQYKTSDDRKRGLNEGEKGLSPVRRSRDGWGVHRFNRIHRPKFYRTKT